jgi:hypothetical protein
MPPSLPQIHISQPTPRRPLNPLLLVVLIAALLRLFFLGGIPASLFRDEAEKALTAWSLLHYQVDLEGRSWPLFIRAFGVTTSAIYQYAALLPIAIFGPTDMAARLPAAMLGIAAVGLLPWALRGLARRPLVLLCALALALSPWHIPMSRWAQQGIFLPVLLLLLYGGLQRISHRRPQWFYLGMASGALACYAYDPARLLVPAFLVGATLLGWSRIRQRPVRAIIGCLMFLAVLSPTIYLVTTQTDAAQARFRAISVFSLPWAESLPLMMTNYLSHFSPDFLMFTGDREPRHGAGGVLGWILGPGLWIGLGTSLLPSVRRRRALLLLLVLLGPIPASLTREGIPHALRTIGTVPFLITLAVLGYSDLIRFVARRFHPIQPWHLTPKVAGLSCAALLLLNSAPFLTRYFGSYARDSAFSWQYGVRESLEESRGLRDLGVPVTGCMIVGGRVIAAWYELSSPNRKSGPLHYPLTEGPFGASPAELDPAQSGQPMAYFAVAGLAPIPGGVRIPIWYRGYGSSDGKNPTLTELHINPAAMQRLRSSRSHAPAQP